MRDLIFLQIRFGESDLSMRLVENINVRSCLRSCRKSRIVLHRIPAIQILFNNFEVG